MPAIVTLMYHSTVPVHIAVKGGMVHRFLDATFATWVIGRPKKNLLKQASGKKCLPERGIGASVILLMILMLYLPLICLIGGCAGFSDEGMMHD